MGIFNVFFHAKISIGLDKGLVSNDALVSQNMSH